MIIKPQATTDNFDLSWIVRDVGCWIYDPNEQSGPIFTKGVVKSIVPLNFNKGNSRVTCQLENGLQSENKASNLEKRRHHSSIERDLISLDIINPAEILFQLRKRFEDKKIHTYMWDSLIIINPFVRIEGTYGEKVMRSYYDKIITQKRTLHQVQPHIYGFVCNILNNMKISQKIQMINISGQSGSGKTQTNKQCLKLISYICESHAKTTELIQSYLIEQRIIKCDYVLECFGNSKTSKNDNSSRFGKLVTQKINSKDMQILQCDVKVFFLQKSRIVQQIRGQRNFHIFYQLVNFCPQNLKIGLGFKNKTGALRIQDFKYLEQSNAGIRDEDREMWENLNQSFQALDINQMQKKHIYEIIAAVLHLGNVRFDQSSLNDHDPCQIMNEDVVNLISGLLMIDVKVFREGLVFNKREIAGDVMYLPMTQRQCVDGRDSIAKALYQNLFFWIVQQLNKKVNQNQKPLRNVKQVKMLDIYGFEVFQHNSFEQLCVNYTNQRIHQLYLDQVFRYEKNLLKKQGLESIISQMKFTDNTKVIELLDTSVKSIFNLLDQNCVLNLKDQDFLSSIKKMCEGHQNFSPLNNVTLKKCFIIKHTPGDIQYMVTGFRNKNKDFLREDIVEKLSKSKSYVLYQKFSQMLTNLKTQTNKKFLGFKIRKDITNLVNEMSYNSDMHFIRCIKPNQAKMGLTFVERVCYNQIKHLGVLDTVRMRKDCYHVRIPYQQFYMKYGILRGDVREMIMMEDGYTQNVNFKEKVKQFMDEKFGKVQLDYLFGFQRIFMKMQTNNYIQAVFNQKTKKIAQSSTILKVIYRNMHKKTQRKNFTVHIRKVQVAMRSYLRDIIMIKRKNAVKIIEREWIKRSQTFFRMKKIIPLKAIQKYIKKIIQKNKFQKQYNSIVFAKNILTQARKTHDQADKFQNYLNMKQLFLSKIYDSLWSKISRQYTTIPEKYIKTFTSNMKNRIKVISAQEKAQNRMLLRIRDTIYKYFKSIPWANKHETYHGNIVKIQKYCRMSLYRKKCSIEESKARMIQRTWRNYKIYKDYSFRKIMSHFDSVAVQQFQWKAQLFRNISKNKLAEELCAVDRILQKFQKQQKQKIVLFYYLLDFQLLCNEDSLQNWLPNYLHLFQESLIKSNPIQYVDVANTHTVAATTSKVYVWGQLDSKIQQFQVSQGKLAKIYANDGFTRIDSINPSTQQIIGSTQEKDMNNQNKQWRTSNMSFVLMTGIILTMQGVSFAKLNTPEKIQQVCCGMGHVICKTILKKIYTWGSNKHGQLGTGDYFDTNSMTPRLVQYFYKKRIPVSQVAASPQSSIVIDSNNKLYWFGTNGTISKVCFPQQVQLSTKSCFLGNHTKYSPIRIISRWSKTMSAIGITIACHDDLLKNQISLRKKVIQNLMMKWNEDIHLINPPYSQSVADHISERHMPLPTVYTGLSVTNQTNKDIRQKIINDIRKLEQAERELLKSKKNDVKVSPRKRY